MDNQYSNLPQFLAEWLGLPLPIVAALATISIFGWVCWRTRSTHVLTKRAWRFVYGNAATNDRDISEFIETRERLFKFRFYSGLQVRTLVRAKTLLRWAKLHDVELSEVANCGRHFDLESLRVREEQLPGFPHRFCLALSTVLFGLFLLISLAGSATPRAILQFKESRTWFFLATDVAVSWSGRGRIVAGDCSQSETGTAPQAPFTAEEKTYICDTLLAPISASFIAKTVHEQRVAFGSFAPTFAFLSIAAWLASQAGTLREFTRRAIAGSGQSARVTRTNPPDLPARGAGGLRHHLELRGKGSEVPTVQ